VTTGLFGDMDSSAATTAGPVLIPVGGHFCAEPEGRRLRHAPVPQAQVRHSMHYGTNPNLKGTPEEYIAALGKSTTRVLNLKFGEVVKF